MNRNKILELIDKFIDRQDMSIANANALEVAIDDAFPDEVCMQDVVLMLASYRPGGGPWLYHEEAVIDALLELKQRLLDV